MRNDFFNNIPPSSYLCHYGVLGMKWGQHRASKYAQKAERAKSEGRNEKAQEYSNKSRKIEKYHTEMAGGKKVYNRVSKMSTGEAIVQSALLYGGYGALKYNQARAKGLSTGLSIVEAALYQTANYGFTGGLGQVVEPRMARENQQKTAKKK